MWDGHARSKDAAGEAGALDGLVRRRSSSSLALPELEVRLLRAKRKEGPWEDVEVGRSDSADSTRESESGPDGALSEADDSQQAARSHGATLWIQTAVVDGAEGELSVVQARLLAARRAFFAVLDGEANKASAFFEQQRVRQEAACARLVRYAEQVARLSGGSGGKHSSGYRSRERAKKGNSDDGGAHQSLRSSLRRMSVDAKAAMGKLMRSMTAAPSLSEPPALESVVPAAPSSGGRLTDQSLSSVVKGLLRDTRELYGEVGLLQHFADQNATAVRKICKKHDKAVGCNTRAVYERTAADLAFWCVPGQGGQVALHVNAIRAELEGAYVALVTAHGSRIGAAGDGGDASLTLLGGSLNRTARNRILGELRRAGRSVVHGSTGSGAEHTHGAFAELGAPHAGGFAHASSSLPGAQLVMSGLMLGTTVTLALACAALIFLRCGSPANSLWGDESGPSAPGCPAHDDGMAPSGGTSKAIRVPWPELVRSLVMVRGLALMGMAGMLHALTITTWRQLRINYRLILFGSSSVVDDITAGQTGFAGALAWSAALLLGAIATACWALDQPMEHWLRPALIGAGAVLIVPLPRALDSKAWVQPPASSRRFVVAHFLRVMTAPLKSVSFTDFFLADQLTSQATAISDAVIATGLAHESGITRAVAGACPHWFRLWQCVRRFRDARLVARARDGVVTRWHAISHLINGGKYLTSIAAIATRLLAARRVLPWPLATTLGVLSALYSLLWDLTMDWRILSIQTFCCPAGGKSKVGCYLFPLRFALMPREGCVQARWKYAAAALLDAMLRYVWLMAAVPAAPMGDAFSEQARVSIFAALEILRRSVWNVLRVENEQSANAGSYRAVGVETFGAELQLGDAFAAPSSESLQLSIEGL